ncbi:MAG: membrane protein insertase YidC [Clostridia bacterium]|nr:membrane protein insertase YidC [Clostridia bacterium]
MPKQKQFARRLTALMLVLSILSVVLFASMAYAEETEATTAAETTAETTATYESVENKDDSNIFTGILRFFGMILGFCNSITGNYILALFIFSVIMQLALCFVGIKQQKNSIGQAKLAPKVAAINKKYAGRTDQQTLNKKQQEIMDLYQKEGFNPMGGCLPLLIQMPILMVLYYVVIAPMTYIMNLSTSIATNLKNLLTAFDPSLVFNGRAEQMTIINWFRAHGSEGIEALKNFISGTVSPVNGEAAANYTVALETMEGKMNQLPNFSVGPVDFAQVPSLTGNGSDLGKWLLLLVPVLTFVFLVLTQYLTKKFTYQSPETKEAQKKISMKIMTYSMPLLSVYFTFIVPAAIGVYWIFRNILSLVQQIILSKVMPIPKFSEEEYKAAEKEIMGSSKKKTQKVYDPNRPKVRSLHHIDDEGYENGYKIDPNAPAESEATPAETTDVTDAPAPIKNDKKAKYTAKSKDEKN